MFQMIPTVKELLERHGDKYEKLMTQVYNSSPLGPIDSNLANTIYGLNHRQTPLALPQNRDLFGLTFMTRPNLNLTTDNLRTIRQFYPLLSNNILSIQRIIRCILDPELHRNPRGPITSPYVDNQQAFIPLLSNTLISMGGWPDISVDARSTPEGHYRESHSMVDSPVLIRNAFEIVANFRNISGNPITLLFLMWVLYQSFAFEGSIMPYGQNIVNTTLDYNTRIYRLTLDPSKKYVQNMACTGASFPLTVPTGAIFNFDSEQPFNDSLNQITIRFQSNGMMANDPIIIYSFNRTVSMFNSGMSDYHRGRAMLKIPYNLLNFFNMRGYPRIDPESMELEWYIPKEAYQQYSVQIAEYLNLNQHQDDLWQPPRDLIANLT